ncbi:MAG: hypothetical protein ACPGOY_13980 [Rhodospirillaceae bacterium]
MRLWEKVFAKKKKEVDFSPKMIRFLENVKRIMSDENRQNAMNRPEVIEHIVGGLDVDELPEADGEFGRAIGNPIPVNGFMGELIYLSRLKTSNGSQLIYHRLGSIEHIDVFETVTLDGQFWDLLFLSMYHPRKSRKAPSGYSIVSLQDQPILFGTNVRVHTFPMGLGDAIAQTTEKIFGVPIAAKEVRVAEETGHFSRPEDHLAKIYDIFPQIHGYAVHSGSKMQSMT